MVSPADKDWSRRRVITLFGWLLILPLAGVWLSMVKRKQEREEGNISRILMKDIPQGYSYHPEYLISRKIETFVIYSTKCTHLGCRMRMSDNGMLICPCHGSIFSPESGETVKGPAEKPLEKLGFIAEEDYLSIFLKQ